MDVIDFYISFTEVVSTARSLEYDCCVSVDSTACITEYLLKVSVEPVSSNLFRIEGFKGSVYNVDDPSDISFILETPETFSTIIEAFLSVVVQLVQFLKRYPLS